MDFNEAQQRALDMIDADVSVSAGAGSGKTRVLVERFCRLVRDNRAKPEEILTVTFTEKAAKEMKERITARFREWADDMGEDRFERAARAVEGAHIGTIHGFATRVLRENSFAAGIDPRFTQITEVEAEIVGERVLDNLMATNFVAGTREYIDLALAIGRSKVGREVKSLAGELGSLGWNALPACEDVITAEQLRLRAQAYTDLGDQIAAHPLEGSEAFVRRLAQFIELYPSVRAAMSAAVDRLALGDVAAYAADFDWDGVAIIQQAKSVLGAAGTPDFKEELAKPAKERAEIFRAAMVEPIAAYHADCLARVAADWRLEYGVVKRRRGVLDFDDLLLAARGLLLESDGRPSPVARGYQARFKYVMIDEFQDTNELQASLVRAVSPPERFFTVGDIKQSIYSFIHSDVEVFQAHHHSIKDAGGNISMDENYRSRPEIIAFVNQLFERLWKEDPGFEFEPLLACGDFYPDEEQPVEFIWAGGELDVEDLEEPPLGRPQERMGEAEKNRHLEARAIAGRIRELLGHDGRGAMSVTKKDDDGGPRTLEAGDILVLLRSTTDIKIYERALAAAGLDYYVVTGRGFYASREVQDIVNLLRAVDNFLDDVAMAAVLRSPMVGITDDALWWLTRESVGTAAEGAPAGRRKNGKIHAALARLAEIEGLTESDREKLAVFQDTFDKLRQMRSDSRLPRLLETAIRLTGYDLKLLAGSDGKRRFANLRKLLDMGRDSSAAGVFNISEFISHLERMKIVAQREGEAPTESEESQAVRLMTVHGAKGLQAPVVFVADCSRDIKDGDAKADFRFDKENGLAGKARNALTNKLEETRSFGIVKENAKARDMAEAKRLFYVAATRAEERLIFGGAPQFDGKPLEKQTFAQVKNWAGWLERALGMNEAPADEDLVVESDGLRLRLLSAASLGERSGDGVPQKEREAEIVVDREALARGEKCEVGPGSCPDVEAMERVRQMSPKGPVPLTVSAVTDYQVCPRKYQLSRILGVEEPSLGDSRKAAAEGHSAPTAIKAVTLGTALHEVFASVDWDCPLERQLDGLIEHQDKDLHREVRALAQSFAASPWPARIQAGRDWLPEAPFSVALENVRLFGRIDLLFREGSHWVVVDYKTGRSVDIESYARQVRLYALAVEKAVGEAPRDVALVAVGQGEDYVEEISPKVLRETEAELVETAQKILAGDFACRIGDGCEHCGYRSRFCKGVEGR